MTAREKAILKILLMIARIIGNGVDGFYSHQLESIINELQEEVNKK